jgi:hypothetical protein
MNDIMIRANSNLPDTVVEMVSARLPALAEKTEPISRSNSQTTLSMMTLTMMSGQSPMRQIRQILAEIDKKKAALAEAQVGYAKLKKKTFSGEDDVSVAKERLNGYRIQSLEVKIENAIKDIATLITAYDALVETHGIPDWTEEDFERAEARHHVRRGFELLYRNLIELGRAKDATIEYLQQFGVHIQVALAEVSGFIMATEQAIKDGERPDSSAIEGFLDQMADKYQGCVGVAAKRMFGREDIVNPNLMSTMEI